MQPAQHTSFPLVFAVWYSIFLN